MMSDALCSIFCTVHIPVIEQMLLPLFVIPLVLRQGKDLPSAEACTTKAGNLYISVVKSATGDTGEQSKLPSIFLLSQEIPCFTSLPRE